MSLGVNLLIAVSILSNRALVDPAPIQISPQRNQLQLVAAVSDAAATTGWKISSSDQDGLRATYERGHHASEVQLNIATSSISLTYVSSKNLDYSEKDGKRDIHKVYREWTGALMSAIQKRLTAMCVDLSHLQDPKATGSSFKTISASNTFLASPAKAKVVRSSSGEPTGYVVREYVAFLPNGQVEDCGPVSTIFYNDRLIATTRIKAEPAALSAYTDILRYLVEKEQITFADAELERMSQKVDTVTPLDMPRRDELLRFVEWQTQRLAKNEISRQEYDYLLAQKESEVLERQNSIQMKEQELQLLQQQQHQQRVSLDLQRQQLAAQRSLAIGQALSNLSQSMSYTPKPLTCSSYRLGNSVQTTCY